MESDSDADEFFDAPDSSEHENICCDSSKDKSENLAQTEEPVPDKDSVENSVLKSLPGSECDDSPSPRVAGTPDIDLLNHGQQAASQLSINGTDKKEVALCGDLTVESATENAIPVVTVTDSQAALNLAMPGSSITGLDNENRLTNRFSMPVSVEDKFDGAPDIVQSTKSSSLNRQGKIKSPIAPPRRKKGPAPPIPVEALSRLPTTDVDVAGAVNHVLIQATGTDNVPLLDISIVTDGSVVVTANEDDSARAEQVSEDSLDAQVKIDDDDEDDQVLEEDVSSSCTSKTSSSLVTITFNVLNGSEDGEINKPVDGSRPRSSSGSRYLTDKEILEHSYVVNLDSGETVPLSLAEEKLPECINPLSLHIMRRTKEYSSDSSLKRQAAVSDDEALKETATLGQKPVKQTGKKRMKIKKFFGKTAHKLKTVADAFHVEENLSDDEDNPDGRSALKVKASHSHKGPYDFDLLVPVQELTSKSMEAVWTMKFSHCGQLLATGGQDNLLRVWVLKTAFSYFDDMRKKYTEAAAARASSSLDKQTPQSTVSEDSQSTASGSEFGSEDSNDVSGNLPFMPQPFCVYKGHTADLLDVSWSKNYFILSSSMDKTVRLWHVSRRECLCCFQHIDFVTAIAFHPKDDRYFLSGSLDGKLRLWNIPNKKVALWNEVEGVSKLITAANFCMNGRFAVVGTYDGRCVFYSAEHLKYHTQLNVRSSRGRNARGRKITGVEPFPGEDKILVTSNDSRIRLYDLRDLTLTCKFKGCTNNSSQIKASFSHDGRYIICGSEDRAIYIWKTQHDFYKFSSARRDRSDYWESVRAHTAVVTSAIFAPCPDVIIRSQSNFVVDNSGSEDDVSNCGIKGEVLVSADYNGAIRVFLNKFVPVESD